ncbi:kelch-like protein 18 [Oppia nitens]|uniref:kelch-like protein 18 n=1 Tax=Oppia nitens TaxID=1686743 RepID=UPI0023DCA275|nr:kelch-like protein 18 [Oppia nitens]
MAQQRDIIGGHHYVDTDRNTTVFTSVMMQLEEECNQLSSLSDECYGFVQKDLSVNSFPIFDVLRKSQKLCDISIKVDNKSFMAHRVVIAATVPYFHAMFTNDMKESTQTEVEIQDSIDALAMEALLEFAYTGRIVITTSNVQSLLIGASFLQLFTVRDACCEYLKIRLNTNNVLGVKSFADSLSCDTLVEASKKFIQKHFKEVSKSDEFLGLDLSEIIDIISKDELNVGGEEDVFNSVMCWVKKDYNTRAPHLPNLLTNVRLPLLSPEFVADYVITEELIRSSHACRDLVDEAKDYHLMPQRRQLLQSFRTRVRCCNDIQGLIYAVGGLTKNGDSLSTVEVFNPQTNIWKMAEAMTMLRSRVGVAVMANKLYAIGGYNGSERLSTVEVFDPKARSWTKVSPMNCKRSAVGAATLNNMLYVCGGYDGISSLSTVECYSLDRNEWSMVTSMSRHRSAAGVVAFEGQIYALGGHDGLSIFDSVERYDPQTGKWSFMPPMRTKRCRLGVATLKGKIFVCGGYDGSTFLQTAEVYDPKTEEWNYIASMNVMRSRVALVANCGLLYAIGGYDGVSNLCTVEVYNSEKNCWEFTTSMAAHEGGVGVGVIPIN